MKIAVLGSGNVGGALGKAWVRAGHDVTFGSRDSDQDAGISGAGRAPVAQAIREAEVVVLAVPWAAVPDVIKQGGDWSGKILIDCTNPIGPGFELAVGHTTSAGEQTAKLATGARVAKAFNTTGFGNMQNPVYGGKPVTMFYASDDPAAQKTAEQLVRDVGFEPVFAGPLKMARYLEPLAMLWINLSQRLSLDFALTIVRR